MSDVWDMQYLEYRMFGIYDVWDMGCLRCNMLGCGIFGIWNVGCRCGMIRMCVDQDVGCYIGGIFKMWNVGDLGYSRCGILVMYNT